jgi:hypothetical protein
MLEAALAVMVLVALGAVALAAVAEPPQAAQQTVVVVVVVVFILAPVLALAAQALSSFVMLAPKKALAVQ